MTVLGFCNPWFICRTGREFPLGVENDVLEGNWWDLRGRTWRVAVVEIEFEGDVRPYKSF
jgi:hypothetical protein